MIICLHNINKLYDGLKQSGQVVECHIIPKEMEIVAQVEEVEIEDIGNVNTIIPELLKKFEMEGIDSNRLAVIYNQLEV